MVGVLGAAFVCVRACGNVRACMYVCNNITKYDLFLRAWLLLKLGKY